MAAKKNRLTIYLIKRGLTDPSEIIEDGCGQEAIEGVGVFYAAESHVHYPDWLKSFFGDKEPTSFHLRSATARGVLLTSAKHEGATYTFAIIFGHGRHLLRDDVVEERFGLRVVLNSIVPTSLRSIDKLSFGSHSKQSREQIGREGDASTFGIDIEQDLVRAVTGRSKIPALGKVISGKDAFAATAEVSAENVQQFLAMCLERYFSSDYKQEFDWIDQLEDVRSTSQLAELNLKLIEKFEQADFAKMWLAPPDILDWADISGFKYRRPKLGDLYDDLRMEDLTAEAAGAVVTLDWLKGTSIYAFSARTGEPAMSWSAYKCLYAELSYDGSMHVLNAGKWYKVADDFSASVNADFAGIPDATLAVPGYSHADEGAYNTALAGSLAGAHCLDADLISHGGGKSKIEFCDVLTSDKRLVHVKRYSGSSQLSHLFSQGVVSGELFVTDASFRKKVNDKVPVHLKLANPDLQPDASEYEIIYGIISRSTNPLDIPFFSKVTVRNAARRLRGYRYKVSKLKIQAA